MAGPELSASQNNNLWCLQVSPSLELFTWRKNRWITCFPSGILVTCTALLAATRALRTGNRTQFNRWLRIRVAAQGFTVVACVAGSLYYGQQARTQAAKEAELQERLEQEKKAWEGRMAEAEKNEAYERMVREKVNAAPKED